MTALVTRAVPQRELHMLIQQGVHPLLSRILAARGIHSATEIEYGLQSLIPPGEMLNAERAGELLADHIEAGKRLLIVADYDCDGATACAVGMRALRAFGARVDYLVPNRFETGYGLSPQVVEIAAPRAPDLLITVDNGIASVEGVDEARRRGIATLVTDHHLPGDALPDAACIVDPNQPGDRFPSKSIAGVGVMFYVMLATRAALRRRGAFATRAEPNLAELLDLVALGTVADVVRLDHNNRVLVSQGLVRIRAGRMQPGIQALFAVAGREPRRAGTFDLGFAIGPRLNAAGRLADMGLGIECLIADDLGRALNIAQELDALNRERRELEASMQREAEALLAGVDPGQATTVCLYDAGWHQGVVGLLASRVKDRVHRPVFAFAPSGAGELRGSGRSIPGLHLRDALDLVSKRSPGLLVRFGGHAAAAGLTLRAEGLDEFRTLIEAAVREMVEPDTFARIVETDGSLEVAYASLDTARMLAGEVWGQGFPPPLFLDEFVVESQRLVGDAMLFRHDTPVAERIRGAYRLALDEFNGVQSVSFTVEHWENA